MKKFFKICGRLLLLCLLVGLVLLGIGYFTVGPEKITSMVSELTKGRINLSSGGVAVDFGNMDINLGLYDVDAESSFDEDYDIWLKSVKKTGLSVAEGQSVTVLNMELGGCEFVLEESEDTDFYFEYSGNGKSQAYIKEDTLYVKVLNTSEFTLNFDSSGGTVTLYVPKEISFARVEVSLGAGEMELDGLWAEQMNFELGAGTMHAKGLQADSLSVSVGAGDIKLMEAQLGNVEVAVGAGNFSVEGTVLGNVTAECSMGNITLKLAGTDTDFNYEIECMAGSVKVDNNEYSGLTQKQSIDNNASKTIDLECAMGNVEVVFE